MSKALYYEARGESQTGKIAVGYVIMNRIRGGYGSGPCDVVSKPRQFSWYGKKYKIIEHNRWQECMILSRRILSEKYEDPTNGSIFFHEKRINPGWKYRKIVVIGSHIFYK
jgi:spore germination cell wall hydrolase CwlJ-like protein